MFSEIYHVGVFPFCFSSNSVSFAEAIARFTRKVVPLLELQLRMTWQECHVTMTFLACQLTGHGCHGQLGFMVPTS